MSCGLSERGAVSLEFMLLFPFIMAILYGAGYYSVLFSWQYRMQSVVDAAAASGMYLDRSGSSDPAKAVKDRANKTLAELAEALPLAVQNSLDMPPSNCSYEDIPHTEDDTITVVKCEIEMSTEAINTALPAINFGFLGQFPPAPSSGIRASAQVAF